MFQCVYGYLQSVFFFLVLFHCCILLEIKLTTTTKTSTFSTTRLNRTRYISLAMSSWVSEISCFLKLGRDQLFDQMSPSSCICYPITLIRCKRSDTVYGIPMETKTCRQYFLQSSNCIIHFREKYIHCMEIHHLVLDFHNYGVTNTRGRKYQLHIL